MGVVPLSFSKFQRASWGIELSGLKNANAKRRVF